MSRFVFSKNKIQVQASPNKSLLLKKKARSGDKATDQMFSTTPQGILIK